MVCVDVLLTLVLTMRDALTLFEAKRHTTNQRETNSVFREALFGLLHGAASSMCVDSTVARCPTLIGGGRSRGLPRPRGTGNDGRRGDETGGNSDGGGGDDGGGDVGGGDGGGGDGGGGDEIGDGHDGDGHQGGRRRRGR